MSGRATSFGSEAERYDRARPGYPSELVERLLAEAPRRVLDVGCGTGKAGRLFAERGCEVVGVEADARMAALARSHGIDVELGRFEEWDPRGRTFDLLVSGQAWHWVDPEHGLGKAAAVLAQRGRFAAFWNEYEDVSALGRELDATYERVAPELTQDAGWSPDTGDVLAQLAATEPFDRAERWHFSHELRYARDEWLDLMQTYSNHILLPPQRLRALVDAVGAVIDAHGGFRVVSYRTEVVTAIRR